MTAHIPAVGPLMRRMDAELRGWTAWEPETLRDALRRQCDCEPSEPVWETLQAARTLRTNRELVETDLQAFAACMHGLNGRMPVFDRIEPCTMPELTYGWLAAQACGAALKPNDEVIAFIRACAAQDGFYAYPEPLRRFEPPRDAALVERIRRAADPDGDAPTGDDEVSVQAAKLGDVYRYCAARQEEANREATKS